MNIKHKGATVKRCEECGHSYMQIGSGDSTMSIRLAHSRPVAADGKGNEQKGKCPLHTEHKRGEE